MVSNGNFQLLQPETTKYLNPTKKLRRLAILLAIHSNPQTSQHKIGTDCSLSSSMVNNYIKQLDSAGLISVSGATNRCQEYYLTEAGQKKLMQSLLEYSAEIIQMYSSAKQELCLRLRSMVDEGIKKVILFGAAETAEVVCTAIRDTPLEIIAIIDSDPDKQGNAFNGHTIQTPDTLRTLTADAVVITSFGKQQEIHRTIKKIAGTETCIKMLTELEAH